MVVINVYNLIPEIYATNKHGAKLPRRESGLRVRLPHALQRLAHRRVLRWSGPADRTDHQVGSVRQRVARWRHRVQWDLRYFYMHLGRAVLGVVEEEVGVAE